MVVAKAKVGARTIPNHVVVDGSNLATEGRSTPSLVQLNEAVLAFMQEFPKTQVTVVSMRALGIASTRKKPRSFPKPSPTVNWSRRQPAQLGAAMALC